MLTMPGDRAMAESRHLMTPTESPFKHLFGAFLLSAAASSSAVSLGPMRGAPIVGRPFDVTLTTQVDPSADLAALCMAADVFFGDNQIPSNRVRISVETGASAREALIRIRTNSAVDEPVVTVLVRGGCAQINTRKYVLLAEIQADRASQTPVAIGEVIASASASAPVTAQLPITRDVGSKASAVLSAPATSSPGTKTPVVRAASAVPRVILPSARLAAGAVADPVLRSPRARLKLDPLDLAAERDPVLRSSLELLTMPSADARQRADAAALWQALNAQPQDVLRDSHRIKVLEADAASMLAQNRKAGQVALELRAQLDDARSERYSNPLVYALGALLTLILLAAIFLWTRSRRQVQDLSDGAWWRKETDPDDKLNMQVSASLNQEAATRYHKPGTLDRLASRSTDSELDLDLGEALVADLNISRMTPAAGSFKPLDAKDLPNFSPSLPSLTGMPRIVNAEELFDVQQQADFFVSLGDFDKAVEVLRGHITDNVETSALAYLDLFDLYHSLGRKDDYELLRQDFNRTFNAQVPAFDDHSTDTHGLEFYTTALSRIESLWPTPKVLDVIEESIFRKPDSGTETFSLAAYRELLLLHAIAKKIIERPAGLENPELSGGAFSLPAPNDPPAFSPRAAEFMLTNIQPLSAELESKPQRPIFSEKRFDLTQPHSSPRLGLDIDLSLDFDDTPEAQAISGANARGSQAVEPDNNLIEFHLDDLIPPLEKVK